MPGSVLIIDADEEFAGRLKSTLESFGARVEVTGDGRAGLDMARINVPDAIVVCVELPRMSGYSICAKLKKDPTLKTVSLVITSAEATQETFEHHKKLKNRAEEYLRKPFTPESLVETLRPYIELEAVPTTPPPAIDDPVLMADATSVFEGEHFHFEQVPDAVEASVAVETIQPPVVPDIHPSIPEPLSDGYEEDEAMTTIGVVPPAGSEVLFKEIEQLRTELEAEREAHAQTVRERDSAVAGERAVTQQLQSVSSGSPSQLSASRDVLSIKKELHDRDKQILELRDAVQQKERELLAQRDKEMELEGRLVQTQEDLEESGRKVSGLQQQVAEFEARVSELNARFEQSEADAAEARSELDAEIGRLKTEIEESHQKIGAHEEEITSLRTTNQALDSASVALTSLFMRVTSPVSA
ncbi:MAG: response regulator, partial [Myxococcota bacterium]